MPPTLAVLPVKSFGRAKQRLAAGVGAPERATLAAAMVGDVLAALRAVPGLDGILVVTGEPRAAAAADEAGAEVVPDPAEPGHSEAAALGVAEARRRGAGRVLLVPGTARRSTRRRSERCWRATRVRPPSGAAIVSTGTARARTRCCSPRRA